MGHALDLGELLRTRSMWSRQTVAAMFSNTALIGKPVYELADKGGRMPVQGAWDPVVDVNLFLAANARLTKRRETRSCPHRRDDSEYTSRSSIGGSTA